MKDVVCHKCCDHIHARLYGFLLENEAVMKAEKQQPLDVVNQSCLSKMRMKNIR